MNANLEEEANNFRHEISFSRSHGFDQDQFLNSIVVDKKRDESIDYFLGANTRRKLLDNINENGIMHPKEDEPVQFSVRDNNELSRLEKHLEEEKEINFKKQTILNLEMEVIKSQEDCEKQENNIFNRDRNNTLWKSNFFVIVYLVSLFISKIKKSSCIYMRKKLAMQHYSMMNDKSFFPLLTKKTIDQKTVEMMRNQNYFLNELRKNVVTFVDSIFFLHNLQKRP